MIFTRKELNQKAIDYVNSKIKDGWVIIYRDNDSSCRDQFFNIERKVSNTEKLGELVSFGLDRFGDYEITIAKFHNGIRTSEFTRSTFYRAYDKVFASTKEEAENLWLEHTVTE